MLPAVVTVVVVLATGDPGDGSTPAIEQSLHAALGKDAVVTVRTTTGGFSDEALAAAAAADHTTLLGILSWADRQRRVTIHFVSPPSDKWVDREVRFDSADAPAERGRTVGFALASMVSEEALAASERARSEPAPPAAPVPMAPTLPFVAAPRAEAPVTPPPSRAYRMAIDASAAATSGVGGYGGGLGGVFAFRLALTGALSARIALGARAGEVAPAQATSRVIGGALGLAWQPWLDADHRWSAGLRLSGLLLRHELVHLSEDDPEPAHRARFMPGLDAALEGGLRVLDYASIIAAAGTEVAFGETDVYVHDRQVASVPPVRLFAEAGIRVAF